MTERLTGQTETRFFNYLIEPGDGTLYRFSYGHVPVNRAEMGYLGAQYIIASGISQEPEDWILVGIQMTNAGLGVINRRDLAHWPAYDNAYYNMKSPGNGFEHVDNYTCIAILFALKALVGGATIDVAAQEMRKAKEKVLELIDG
jgi:hypothetical protein